MFAEKCSVESDVMSDTESVASLEEPVSGVSVQGRLRSHSVLYQ